MELWISSEYSGDIDETLRFNRNFIEDEINSIIRSKDYNLKLNKWRCLTILMENSIDRERYCEITKYSAKTQKIDFKLQINYEDFIRGDDKRKQQLIYQMLMRSLNLLIEKNKLNKEGIEALRADTKILAIKNNWIE